MRDELSRVFVRFARSIGQGRSRLLRAHPEVYARALGIAPSLAVPVPECDAEAYESWLRTELRRRRYDMWMALSNEAPPWQRFADAVRIGLGSGQAGAERTPGSALAGSFTAPALDTMSSAQAAALLAAQSTRLLRHGFRAAGRHAIGMICHRRYSLERAMSGSGPLMPESRTIWGHTAVFARVDDHVTAVRGYGPESWASAGVADMRTGGGVRQGRAGVPAAILDDSPMFLHTDALTIEYPVTRAQAASFLSSLPAPGPLPGHRYACAPWQRNTALGINCVVWAAQRLEHVFGGKIGPDPEGPPPPRSFDEQGPDGEVLDNAGSQGQTYAWILGVMRGDPTCTPAEVEAALGPPVVSRMPAADRALRWRLRWLAARDPRNWPALPAEHAATRARLGGDAHAPALAGDAGAGYSSSGP
jgi:hypothetical protein